MKEARDTVDKWFGKPTIPKQTDKMLEDVTKFKGDGTDELTRLY